MAKNPKNAVQPKVENLEARALLTTVAAAGSTLNIAGTLDADNIQVTLNEAGRIAITGVSATFSAAQIKSITISSSDGDDVVVISDQLSARTTVYAGDGNDFIVGGSGHDRLYGQAGDDTIQGGAGNDHLSGGPGSDSMDGGAGWDSGYDVAASTWLDIEARQLA